MIRICHVVSDEVAGDTYEWKGVPPGITGSIARDVAKLIAEMYAKDNLAIKSIVVDLDIRVVLPMPDEPLPASAQPEK